MREITRIDSFPKALSLLTGMTSVAMMFYGFYGELYWAGFGLVLLMPSLLILTSL